MPSPFALDPAAYDREQVFRVQSYTIQASSPFTGATYDLVLDHDLASDYFVLLQPTLDTTGNIGPGPAAVMVTHDPTGTGDLGVSANARTIRLSRGDTTHPWLGTITVIECLKPDHASGFKLNVVKKIALTVGGAGVSEVSISSGVAYNSRQVPFGGFWAGGLSTTETANDRWPTVFSRVRLTSDGNIRVRRWNSGAATVQSAEAMVFIITWGTDWTVQNVGISGGPIGGADLNIPGEFLTAAISTVVRARTWLWATGITPNTLPNGMVLATLGDGVNENVAESTVAAGVWAPDNLEAEFWVLTHSYLSVDWQPTESSSSFAPKTMTTTSPIQEEGYRSVTTPLFSWGRRALVLHFGAESNVAGGFTEALIYGKIISGTSLELWRRDNVAAKVVGWVQVVDFGAVVAETQPTTSPGPIQGVLLPDLELTAEAISSVTSRSGFRLGPVIPSSDNVGRMFGFHSGDPSADLTFTYRVTSHGDLGDAGWVFQEEGASYWYGWNAYNFLHGTHPINAETTVRYGFVCCYSSAYDRMIAGYLLLSTSSTLYLYRHDQDGDAFAYSLLGTVALDNSFTFVVQGTAARIRMVELDDGSLRMLVLVTDETGAWDFDLYSSVDGGDSWTRIATRIIWRANGGTAITSQPISVAFAASGDWLRIVWVDASVEDVITAVSSTRGTSWEYLGVGSSTISTGSNGFTPDAYPITLAGRPDGAGTFLLWVRDQTSNYIVNAYTSTRDEEWVADTDLDFNLTSGHEVEHLASAYTPDGIFLISQVNRSSIGQISLRLRVYDVDDPQGVNSAVGTTSIYGPGVIILPYDLHLLNGGRELLVAGNALDFAGTAVVGMFLGRLAGWSQVPVQSTNSDGSVSSQTWAAVWSDSPSGGTYAIWPRFQSGSTLSSTRVRMNVQTSAVGQYSYWEFSPSTTGLWNADGPNRGMSAGGLLRVPQSAGNVANANIGVKVRAQGAGASGVSFMLTATTTQITLWDLLSGGGTQLGTISAPTLATSWWEFRVGLLDNFDVFMAARPYEGSTWKARGEGWSRVAGSLVSVVGITLDLLQVGHQSYSGSGTNESEWREVWVSDSYGNNLQRTGVDWTLMNGRTTTSRPQRVYSGVDVFWGGGGAARADTFTGEVSSAYPPEAVFLDSPRYYWEAADDGSQSLVLDFGAGTDAGATFRRSLHEGCFLVGTRARYATVDYSQADSWSSPAFSYTLDSTLFSSIRILAVNGDAVLVEYPSLPATAASLAGSYLRVTAGATTAANGKTWRVRKHGAPSEELGKNRAWLYLESEQNTSGVTSYGISAGDTACVFGDRMAALYGEAVKTRYMRVSFSSEEVAPNGKHALGGMVAGPFFQFDPPLDWTWKDNSQPNTSTFSSKSGVTWRKKEGPAQRVFQGRMVGDQTQRARESFRDLLRLFADYDRRPVALLTQIPGKRPLPQGCLYGYITTGGQLDNEGWWKDEDGIWRPAGDLSVEVQEVV